MHLYSKNNDAGILNEINYEKMYLVFQQKHVLRYVNIFMNHYVDKNMLKLQCHLYEFAARRNKCKIL